MLEVSKFTPISNLILCRDTGLTAGYKDCLTFQSEDARYQWFLNHRQYQLANLTPIRNNVVRVPYAADDLVRCDYLLYQNPNLNNKWFYCFITKIEWINVHMSEITFDIDVITTYQFDARYNPSFIERMHVRIADDTLGNYTQPEPFSTSNKLYLCKTDSDTNTYKYILYYIPADGKINVPIVDDIRNMCNITTAPATAAGFKKLVDNYIQPLIEVGLQDNIIALCLLPKWVVDEEGEKLNSGAMYIQYNGSLRWFQSLDGYVPVNQKLLTYPYNSLVVGTANGMQCEYQIEKFNSSTTFEFKIYTHRTPDCVLYGVMNNYASQLYNDQRLPNMADINVCSGFPQLLTCGIQSLAYTQNVTANALNTVVSVLGMAQNAMSFNPIGMVSSAASTVNNALSTYAAIEKPPYAITGSLPTSSASATVFGGRFMFIQHCITYQDARVYDKYLTRWGYSINSTEPLNFRKRYIFDYIKTRDANISGAIPQEHLQEMRQAFDQGITFWHTENGQIVGSWDGSASSNYRTF